MRCLHLIPNYGLACKRKKRMCQSVTEAYPHRKNFKGCAALFEIGEWIRGACTLYNMDALRVGENYVKRVGIVGEVRRTRFGWVRWQSDAEVVCWAVVRTCRRLVSTGRIYRVAWNEVKVPLSVVERSVCASPVAVLVCATLP